MKCYDFEYDNQTLSSFGFVICKFDSGGTDSYSNGSVIDLNTVSTQYGAKVELASSRYDECISATFQICIDPCNLDFRTITVEEMRSIMRWLNRRGFHKMRLIDPEYTNIYYMATFNVNRVEFDGQLVGFELEMSTDSPFAHYETVRERVEFEGPDDDYTLVCQGDEEGYVYPETKIVVNQEGDLSIHNDFEDRTTLIRNCKNGETITMRYPVIETSDPDHKIMDDFNWLFFRLSNTFRDRNNRITASIPCSIELRYDPIVKIGV